MDHCRTRLLVAADLGIGRGHICDPDQAHFLLNVLRLGEGDEIHVFNGRDGEWRARIRRDGKRGCRLEALALVRPQADGPDLDYLFAPLKHARLDYMVQKATELGVARLQPVLTRRTNVERIKTERMRANVVEAAEQCGILRLPDVGEPKPLRAALAELSAGRRLVFCDEDAPIADPIAALRHAGPGPLALLVGPEGGFDPDERAYLIAVPGVIRLSLGPRIMRADTAAVAALALVNATLGDWR